MASLPRPLIALLVATVAFFALWTVALKPSSSSNGGSGSQGLGAFQSDINAAHNAVTTENNSNAASAGQAPATTTAPIQTHTSAPSRAPAANPTTASRRATQATSARVTATSGAARVSAVDAALAAHRVIALLFYNPGATDDRAVKQELGSIPSRGDRVLKLAVPQSELSQYAVVTNQVQVTETPTLVVIDPASRATTLVGFADTLEIAQRIDDALAVK
jgi:hypothetical protein